ncbi:MAG: hypothetical protein AUH68_04945 [Gemmatimonadetes bacterium 13_1_40CM_4_69_5]|nr:MAG: hypothetical protein AUH68_04945 [Gemmatimonadetes bacterium 13_1_40CM_4_69_5]
MHEAVPRVGCTSQAIQRRVPELHGGHGGGRIELSRLFEASDARARDSAWADFVAAHSRLLLHVARSLTTDHDAAMDGYAHVLERLREHDCRRLRGYAPDGRTKFTTWLVVVARRLCLDFHRHRYGRSDDPAPDAAAARAARRRLVNLVAGETRRRSYTLPSTPRRPAWRRRIACSSSCVSTTTSPRAKSPGSSACRHRFMSTAA